MSRLFNMLSDGLLKRLSENEDVEKEILNYFNEIITDWHDEDFSKINTRSLRNKIFEDHKCELINYRIDDLTTYNKELEAENEKLREELRGSLTFSISKEDKKKIEEWDNPKTGHKCKYKPDGGADKYCGAIGGHLTYEFTPTGLGNVVKVKCGCGEELDLTNVDNW